MILHSTDFQLSANEIVGLVGKSGAGKTTLVRLLSGYLTPSTGHLTIQDEKQSNANNLLIPGYTQIAYVSQAFEFDPYRTSAEVLRLAMTDLVESEKLRMIDELLALVDLTNQENQQVKSLSGGEKQRLAVLYALALERPFLFLDEPFVHMDNRMRRRVIDYLIKLKELRGLGVLIVSHQAEEILGVCDRVVYLKNGRVKRQANPEQFFYTPKTIEEAELFGPINSVNVGGKRHLFRPNAYSLSSGAVELSVTYISSEFQGMYWMNKFKLPNQRKEIILFSLKPLSELNKIYIG